MTVAHVATGSIASTAAGTTLAITSPAGSIGDLLLFFGLHDDYSDGDLTPSSPPITLTVISDGSPQLGDDHRSFIYFGIEDQEAGRAFTFGTLTASEQIAGACVRYSGHHATTPIQSSSLNRAIGFLAIGNSADVFGGMFISIITADLSVSGASWAPPAGWTQRVEENPVNSSLRFDELSVDQYPLPQVIPNLDTSITSVSLGNALAQSFIIAPAETSRTLAGVTKDKDGNTLATCEVALFKEIGGTPPDYQFVESLTSDGSGNYSFTIINDNDAKFMVFSIKDDAPHVFDATDNVLQPT